MSDPSVGLQALAGLVVSVLAAFSGLALLDPPPPQSAPRLWVRRAGCALALAAAAWAPFAPLSAGVPALGWTVLLAGSALAAVMIDQRPGSNVLHAAAALPFALGTLGLALSLPAGTHPAEWWPAAAVLLLTCGTGFMVAAHFRRRRSGSPLQLGTAAAVLVGTGLFCAQLLMAPTQDPGAASGLLRLAIGALALAVSVPLAAPRWLAARDQRGGLRRSSRTDPVSGLPVLEVAADSFLRVLRFAVATRSACALVVLHFEALERVLSTQGKSERDRLYAAAAWRLRSVRRDEELIAAIGDQRFLLVLRVGGATEASARVRQLIGMFEQPLGEGEGRVRLRPSAGLSLWPDHGDDFQRLLANALLALERCPPGGLQVFHATQREENEHRMQVENRLSRALGEGEIGLVMQPIVDSLSGDVRMVELLARWNHPTLGSVSPRQFILVAESSGAIAEFDRWLLREALSTTKWLDAAGFPQIRVALNCSPLNLVDPGFLDDFECAVLDSGVDPARLEVEVTEAALAESEGAAVAGLIRLRSLGVGLTIDDFGIGHSSLARLRDLPVDTLKIDQSFIRDMDHPKGEFLVSGILGLAHGLGKAVIAEGVETASQSRALVDLGCEYLQGFLISRPLSWRALLDFLGAETGIAPDDPALLRARSDSAEDGTG
ncbi:bifunctional diguanylate cyclase/phosphodiesterase [Pseudomarimonas salicorniae]|uniref:Bifunctional diguanylate cyclase/phosphodiesterase n=1 Tax=Pseudomarimonas salicorniae TaxID=2933270 RepID=A0ABT0GHC7_9GAMM|nr:bifunctional diguanylate cyclase/phosphodiesterase [Lysobacter sp. CAU 1642]MCK7593430.1 bifunctional diguanylate cyclase/phosphodiesterase [Lysobacter sp. CAU 1642]